MGPEITSEGGLRAAAALVGLLLAFGLERTFPFRGHGEPRREIRHLAVWSLGALAVRTVPFAAGLAAAEFAQQAAWGLLNLAPIPFALAVALAVVALDGWTYAVHRAYHGVPWLWRLHRIHHSDSRLSATTGVRFHPCELLLSALMRVPFVVVLGLPPLGVLLFEATLLLASQLQHADVRLPDRWAERLGALLMTPNLHRTHHSTRRVEANCNFGAISSGWDRVLGTLMSVDPEQIEVGAPDVSHATPDASFWKLLALPFAPIPDSRQP